MIDKIFNILINSDIYDEFYSQLNEKNTHFRWFREDRSNNEKLIETKNTLHKIDCIVSRADLTEEEFELATRVKLFQLPISGYDKINLKRWKSRNIPVANNGGANAVSVAEHVFLMILSLYRHLLIHHNSVVDGRWINLKHQNKELFGKNIGIIGFGNIGKEVAKRAIAFGMNVNYFDIKHFPEKIESLRDAHFLSFEKLLSISDIVTFHVPLTNKTKKLINSSTIQLMKTNAILINTSRGAIQDENAIYQALKDKKIAGAGLDVFSKEPFPLNSPLLTLDNIILSPHSGPSFESRYKMIQFVLNNIERVYTGKRPLSVVTEYNE